MKITVNSKTLPIAQTLPPEFLSLVGEIVVAWAIQELALRRTVFAMLDLSEAKGRIAVRTPRAKEMVEMIADIALTENFTIDLSGLSLLDELETRRNKVAHGIWFDAGNGKFLLQDLHGRMTVEKGFKLSKRIAPAGVPITVTSLTDLLGAIRTVTLNTYTVAEAIAKRRSASRQTHPAPSLNGDN